MRCYVLLTVAVVVMFVSGLSTAQEEGLPEIPEKIQTMYKNSIGAWALESKVGDVVLKGTLVFKWGPDKQYVVATHRFESPQGKSVNHMLLSWDGKSQDGFIMYRVGPGGYSSVSRGKAVSDTVTESTVEGVADGKSFTQKMRIEYNGRDKMIATANRTSGDISPVWRGEYTKVKKARKPKRQR